MKVLFFSFLVFVTISCTHKSEKQPKIVQFVPLQVEESTSDLPEKYEEIEINLKGKIQKFKFKEYNKEKVLAIKKLIESGQKLEYYKRELIDVTGEGNLDTVEIKIEENGKNSFLLTNSIFTHGKYAWRDTLDFGVDENSYDFFLMFWDNDSTFYKLLPYSIYNQALYFKDFIIEGDAFNESDFYEPENLKYYEDNIKSQLKYRKLLEKYKNYDGRYFDLINKKSLRITSLSYNSSDINVWLAPEQVFIQIFAP